MISDADCEVKVPCKKCEVCCCETDNEEFVNPRIKELIVCIDIENIDWKNPVIIAVRLAGKADTFKELAGAQKFTLVKVTLKMMVSNSEISPEVKQSVNQFLDVGLKPALDAAVLVSKFGFSDFLKSSSTDLVKQIEEVGKKIEKQLEDNEKKISEAQKVVAANCTSCWGKMRCQKK